MAKEIVEWSSEEMEVVASKNHPEWKKKILTFVSKLLNVKQKYPFYWRHRGRKLEQCPTKEYHYIMNSGKIELVSIKELAVDPYSHASKNPIKWLSEEMEEIAGKNQPRWKMAILNFVSKLLNVKEVYPFYWRHGGKKLEQHPSKPSFRV